MVAISYSLAMNADEIAEKMREIFDNEKQNDLFIDSITEVRNDFGVELHQIHIQYQNGNEWLPITRLSEEFAKLGPLLVEYRGRGRNETPKLVLEVKANTGIVVQMIYHFG